MGVRREKMYRLDDHIACAVSDLLLLSEVLDCVATALAAAADVRILAAFSHGCNPFPCCCFCSPPQVAGITADANILVNSCRLAAQRYLFTYQVGGRGWLNV